MNADHGIETQLGAAGPRWANALRREVVDDLGAERVERLSLVVAGVAVHSASTVSVAAGAAATAQGGTAMTTPIAATAATHGLAKIAGACVLAAGLTVGGTAAITGNLPDGPQQAVADVGAAVGLNLPGPSVDAAADAGASARDLEVVTIAGVCDIRVGLDNESRLVLGDITTAAGFSAEVVVETASLVVVDLTSTGQVVSVELTERAGTIHAEVITRGVAEGTVGLESSTEPDRSAVVDVDLRGASSLSADVAASADGKNDGGDGETTPSSPCRRCGDDGDGVATGLGLDAAADLGAALDTALITNAEDPCGCDSSSDGGSTATAEAAIDVGLDLGLSLGG